MLVYPAVISIFHPSTGPLTTKSTLLLTSPPPPPCHRRSAPVGLDGPQIHSSINLQRLSEAAVDGLLSLLISSLRPAPADISLSTHSSPPAVSLHVFARRPAPASAAATRPGNLRSSMLSTRRMQDVFPHRTPRKLTSATYPNPNCNLNPNPS